MSFLRFKLGKMRGFKVLGGQTPVDVYGTDNHACEHEHLTLKFPSKYVEDVRKPTGVIQFDGFTHGKRMDNFCRLAKKSS